MNIFVMQAGAMLVIVGLWAYMLLAEPESEAEWRKWLVMILWLGAVVVLIGTILAGALGYVGSGHGCICD